ncbi:hypothetical protein HF329_00755 [Chitinophaga oryzae]|uniref:Uncharacterized protein n=1 Tax=Chitinophaga oryzae TaxID=2725414 RepID=A0AAE6ZBJ9_9BACT|nr:hypothetical protein [Chitinophaga oryzae]QJB29913.1 hypothetical protein HF329_00755 [Chitinophaga oryzae]
MKKEKQNILFNLHEVYSKMAANFRNKVCEDCNWSMPTFYRKMRTKVPRNSLIKLKGRDHLSLAEERRIAEIKDEINESFIKSLEKY